MGKKNIIAFQGIPGAHADLACRQAYPYMEPKAYPTFDDAIAAVENEEADLCIIPIENSHAGRVAEIHNLLPRTDLYIVGEYFLRIEHHLLGVKGAKVEDVKEVHSHPQAIMQCHSHLREYNFEAFSSPNTAIAASNIAKEGDKTKAALGSKLAGELYGLEVLQENVEDAEDNMTVFIAMAREPFDPEQDKGRVITSVLFMARNIPAALYKALGGFATNHVNMLKIESYIPSGKSQSAQFFITFDGHPDQKNVQLALEELGFFCRKLKVLGVYYADEKRYV